MIFSPLGGGGRLRRETVNNCETLISALRPAVINPAVNKQLGNVAQVLLDILCSKRFIPIILAIISIISKSVF